MKIFYSAVFDNNGQSSDSSKLRELEALGHTVVAYDYRVRGHALSRSPNISPPRDNEIIEFCQSWQPDFIIFAKCNGVDIRVFEEVKKVAPVCYWFADPYITYDNEEFFLKTQMADFFTCDKKNVYEKAITLNPNTFIVPDGYDRLIEKQKDVEKKYDVSFIGNLYGDRQEKITQITHPVALINNVFGEQHSVAVSATKVNLNFCTSEGPSDRVFKVLGTQGFLITDEWLDRPDYFEDGEDLVVFKDFDDLNQKIEFYLNNDDERARISANGHKKVQRYTREQWAKKTVSLFEELKTPRDLPKSKERVLVAGPWVGEFGWELFAWHAYVRSMASYYDKTVCISSEHSKFLYEDFCDVFIPFEPAEGQYKDSFYKVGFQLTNKMVAEFLKTASLDATTQQVNLVLPRRIGDPPRTHYTEKFNFGPLYISPKYIKLGTINNEHDKTVVVHARDRALRTQDNWPQEKWNILVDKLLQSGYNVLSIGLKNESLHIKGSEDMRECEQTQLLNILASAVCIFGPSSGAMHLASLCGCPQVVWTTDYNLDRYTKNWNPHNAEILFLSDQGWQPSPEYVYNKFETWKRK